MIPPFPGRLPRGFSVMPLRRIQRRMRRYYGVLIPTEDAWQLYWRYGPAYPSPCGLCKEGIYYCDKLYHREFRKNGAFRLVDAYRLAWETLKFRLPRNQQPSVLSLARSRAKKTWWAQRKGIKLAG